MKKKIVLNMVSALLLEAVSLVCAFILPRLIMVNFGSEYNGIVSSVSQFLSFITLLRGGIGGVTRAALYKPLLENDIKRISEILRATEIFMRKVTYIFVAFLTIFAIGYPFIVKNQFGWFYTFSLVIILGVSTITQYYFGITYQFLIQADQKQYIYDVLQMIATVVNTLLSVIFIRLGMEFRIVKLTTAIVFGAIPIVLYYYVKKHYGLIKNCVPDNSTLGQRWDAFAHQVAAFVNSNTDIVLITLFGDLFQVAIYSVYFMVANGIKKFVNICSSGIEAALGKLLARNDQDRLKKGIELYEWLIHVVSTSFFMCTAVLFVPFVMIYTKGVYDTDYYQPFLGYLMCIAQFMACVRMPYQNMVEAAGHFKATRNGAVTEAVLNIIITIPMVCLMGCSGAVIGTIVATSFRTIQYARYSSKEIIKRPFSEFVKRMIVSVINMCIVMIPYILFNVNAFLLTADNYYQWMLYAFVSFAVIISVSFLVNLLFYWDTTKYFLRYVFGRITRNV